MEHMKRLRELRTMGQDGMPCTPSQLDVPNEPNAIDKEITINNRSNDEHAPTQFDLPNEPNSIEEETAINHQSNYRHTQTQFDVTNVPNARKAHMLTPPRFIHRKPKYLININENTLKPMPDKLHEQTCIRMA